MLSNSEPYGKSQSFWKAYSEKLTWAFIMIFLLIFPLFVDGTGYAKITEAKYHFFVWTTSIYPVSYTHLDVYKRQDLS